MPDGHVAVSPAAQPKAVDAQAGFTNPLLSCAAVQAHVEPEPASHKEFREKDGHYALNEPFGPPSCSTGLTQIGKYEFCYSNVAILFLLLSGRHLNLSNASHFEKE